MPVLPTRAQVHRGGRPDRAGLAVGVVAAARRVVRLRLSELHGHHFETFYVICLQAVPDHAVHEPVGWAVTPRMCTARVWISITNKTYRRWSSTVSTCRKSRPRIPDAWAARNCRQGGGARRGAGPSPAQPGSGGSFPPLPGTRRRATRPECAGNLSAGSTAPSCSTRPRTSAGTGGRPTEFGYVHFLRTRRRCQASKVPEVTIRCSRRPEGSSRESAAITAVSPVRPWTGDLPPQDRDLMPQHQDLCILDGVTSRQ